MVARGRSVSSDVAIGVCGGLLLGLIYSGWVTFISMTKGPEAFDRQGVSYSSLVKLYLGAGMIGGGIVGLLKPLTATRMGARMVGIIAALPMSFGLGLTMTGMPSMWDWFDWLSIGFFTVLIGWVLGGIFAPPKG